MNKETFKHMNLGMICVPDKGVITEDSASDSASSLHNAFILAKNACANKQEFANSETLGM